MWRLQVLLNGREVNSLDLKMGASLVVGRDPGVDVVVPERSVSRRHCRVEAHPESVLIEDLGSANGIYCRGELTRGVSLKAGEEVQLGMAVLRVVAAQARTGLIPMTGLFDQQSSTRGSQGQKEASAKDEAVPVTGRSSDESDASRSVLNAGKSEYKALEKERLALLIEAGKSLSQSIELNELFERIMDHLFQILPVRRASIILMEDDGRLVLRHLRPARDHAELSEVGSRHIIRQVIENDRPEIIDDASLDQELNMAHSILAANIKAAICAPLRSNNKSIGALYADYPGRARLYSQSDLDFFGAFASLAAVALDNARLQSQVRERERLQRDLEIAGEIQRGLLPDGNLDARGVELDWAYWPSRHVGGDFYDCIPVDENRSVFCLGDVSGKSVGAALFMARLVSFLRAVILDDPDPGRVFTRTNRLLGIRTDHTMFATALCVAYDQSTREIQYASAGHWPALLLKPDTGEFFETERMGIPLGIFDGTVYETNRLLLPEGTLMILYTDGIVEARNPLGEQYGLDRLKQVVLAGRGQSVKDLTQGLLHSVGQHCLDSSYSRDDIAIMVARLRPGVTASA
ncbi:MAG TPA: SpoIIE family protein phosphatase [Planctomycetota bacterium]|jgi:serine phosphatase RsbU (regulator of sigma subunit)|nr:SpoIIE family protein phosphatase [Planctomycetota bacterium]